MKDLIEIHNQYLAGMMTFTEFFFAFGAAMTRLTHEEIADLRMINSAPYAQMVEWENTVGLSAYGVRLAQSKNPAS